MLAHRCCVPLVRPLALHPRLLWQRQVARRLATLVAQPSPAPRSQDGGVAVDPPAHGSSSANSRVFWAPGGSRRIPLSCIVADEWTPNEGTVMQRTAAGIQIDFGCEVDGLLPATGLYAEDASVLHRLRYGDRVTVYVASKQMLSRRVRLTLSRREVPRERWAAIVADGRRPYEAVVCGKVPYGVFLDCGFESVGLVSAKTNADALDKLEVGDRVTAYVTSKHRDTWKLNLALEPHESPLQQCEDLPLDGRTPISGVVINHSPGLGTFVDIGCSRNGMLPHDELAKAGLDRLSAGDRIKVYFRRRHVGKVHLALQPRTVPLRTWDDIVPDGQTPHPAVVADRKGCLIIVDIGCDTDAVLHAEYHQDPAAVLALRPGTPVEVYVVQMMVDSAKITVSLERRASPIEQFDAVVCDGQTPYEGRVATISHYGVFVDFGAVRPGLLNHRSVPGMLLDKLSVGDQVTVFVVQKVAQTGKIYLALEPLETRLVPITDIAVDGQTPYDGVVVRVLNFGLLVDIGASATGLLPRTGYGSPTNSKLLGDLAVGNRVRVYAFRRNVSKGSIVLSLTPAEERLKSIAEVVSSSASIVYAGIVYNVQYGKAYVDIGCEASGILPLPDTDSSFSDGDRIGVHVRGFNEQTCRFELSAAQEPSAAPRNVNEASANHRLDAVANFHDASSGRAAVQHQSGSVAQIQNDTSSPAAIPSSSGQPTSAGPAPAATSDASVAAVREAPPPAGQVQSSIAAAQPHTSERCQSSELAGRVQSSIAAAQPYASEPQAVANHKGKLQELVMRSTRASPRKGDVTYATDRIADGRFVARVSFREGLLPGAPSRAIDGEPRATKSAAQQSAAQAALVLLSEGA